MLQPVRALLSQSLRPRQLWTSALPLAFSMILLPYSHARALRPAAPLLALAAVALSSLSACSVNDLFLEPREAQEVQAADPVDPRSYGDQREDVAVLNAARNKLTGWLFSRPG